MNSVKPPVGGRRKGKRVLIFALSAIVVVPLVIGGLIAAHRARPITVDAPTRPPVVEGNSFEVLKRACLDTLAVAKRSYQVREAERRFSVGGDPRDKTIEEQAVRQLLPLRIRYEVPLRKPCAPTDPYDPTSDTEYLGATTYWTMLEAILIDRAFESGIYDEIATSTRNLVSLALAVSKGQGSSHSYASHLSVYRLSNVMDVRIVNLPAKVAKAVASEIERYEKERVTLVQRLEFDRAYDINLAKCAYDGELRGVLNDTSWFDRAIWDWASDAETADALYRKCIEEVKKPFAQISDAKVVGRRTLRLLPGPQEPKMMVSGDASRMSKLRLIRVACLITAFRAFNGRLPRRLEELRASGIKDPYSNAPLTYRVVGGKYLLYSVGSNLKDDGGVHYRGERQGDITIGRFDIVNAAAPTPGILLR